MITSEGGGALVLGTGWAFAFGRTRAPPSKFVCPQQGLHKHLELRCLLWRQLQLLGAREVFVGKQRGVFFLVFGQEGRGAWCE